MAINKSAYLRELYQSTKALGEKVISSDFTMEIEGHEGKYLLCKQAPWPENSSQGEIEIPGPVGMTHYEAQQIKTAHQGQVSFYETTAGDIDKLLIDVIAGGGYFNAKIYEGTPDKYLRYKRIIDCFLQIDDPDRDWENRSQPLMFSGTMFYQYFGEVVEGNSTDYN